MLLHWMCHWLVLHVCIYAAWARCKEKPWCATAAGIPYSTSALTNAMSSAHSPTPIVHAGTKRKADGSENEQCER